MNFYGWIRMELYGFSFRKKHKHGGPPLNLTLNPCFSNYCYMNNMFIYLNKYKLYFYDHFTRTI